MQRKQATSLLQELLTRAQEETWPASLVTSVHVFGSYARGATNPGDVDVAVDIERDDRWVEHFVASLTTGRDPYTILRMALRGRRRGVELVFERQSGGYDSIPMTLIWKRGEPISAAIDRLSTIPEDPDAGRAPREAMLPCFDGLEDQLPLFVRESFMALADAGTISIEQITLGDAESRNSFARNAAASRWKEGSPLRRAAEATLSHLESQGVDIHAVHLHGRDVDMPITPYFVGFQLRYIRALPWCFSDQHGVQWIEIPKPTKKAPLVALQVQLLDRARIQQFIREHPLSLF